MSDWIDWHGGECPVGPDVEVHIQCASGDEFSLKARHFDWNNDPDIGRIIRYRILSEPAEPQGVRLTENQFEALADWLLEMTRSDISAVAIKRAEITARIAFGLPPTKEQDHE